MRQEAKQHAKQIGRFTINSKQNKTIFIYVSERTALTHSLSLTCRWFTVGIIFNWFGHESVCGSVSVPTSFLRVSFTEKTSKRRKARERQQKRASPVLFMHRFYILTDIRWIKSKSATFLPFFSTSFVHFVRLSASFVRFFTIFSLFNDSISHFFVDLFFFWRKNGIKKAENNDRHKKTCSIVESEMSRKKPQKFLRSKRTAKKRWWWPNWHSTVE